ncbi:alpha/beta hydrolase [Gracilibacillus sp. S3-1-1]|uniref:Alpha/beta hydrolase n=1 Tax=Gracilibacillus pellucidus TaxID=3095368 RepID=A0ACC6M1M2_9BACI|nr:alpha/beta hydrolase [Gracilibacillus sp. S3-1-1]MDX8044780.1 alpha/beta hydrolase [Gracilibacillus sp. S3-1-1]
MMQYKGHDISYTFHKQPLKPVIIMLHGLLASSYSFRKLIPLLQTNFQILTIDIPPFGESSKNAHCLFCYEEMVDAIHHLMKEQSIKQAIFVGHSMGGQISLRFAYKYPDNVKHLYLLAPCSFMRQPPPFSNIVYQVPFSPFVLRELLKRKGVYQMLRHSIYHDYLITDDMLEHYKKPFLDKTIYPCLVKVLHDHQGDLSEEALLNISIPTSIVWGRKDEIVPCHIGYELIRYLPNATLTTFDHTGHLLPEEIPNEIAKLIGST